MKGTKFKSRKSDSLNLLRQNSYIFDSLNIDAKINSNIKIANIKEIAQRIEQYQFSNPEYFDKNYVYIEVIYYKSVFGIGFGYLLEKEKNENWTIKKVINTFIT